MHGAFQPALPPARTLVKWGSVRCWKPKGIRLPSTFCCPTQPIIWEMLMKEPLEPLVTILMMLFCARSQVNHQHHHLPPHIHHHARNAGDIA